jgi:hypothetical protein
MPDVNTSRSLSLQHVFLTHFRIPQRVCIRHQYVLYFLPVPRSPVVLDILARSYPASGTFTGPQRDLYSAVLTAQKTLITYCSESSEISLHDLHRKSCELLRQELNQIGFGLQTGDLERMLYPHFLSHPIGIGELTICKWTV